MVKFYSSGWRQPWRPQVRLAIANRQLKPSSTRPRGVGNPKRIAAARAAVKSKLHTKTKSKLFETAIRRVGPTTETFFEYRYHKRTKLPKNIKRLLGEQIMVCNEKTRLDHAVNTQATTVLPAMFNWADVGNILAGAATAITASGTSANYKVLLESCNAKLMCTNQSNDVIRVSFYDCVPRRDITNASYCPPNNAWITGDAATTTTGGVGPGGTGAYAYVGSTPFNTPAFTRLYKVQKVTTVDIATGGHHTHLLRARPFRLFDKQTSLEINGGSNTGLQYLTAFTMIVQHGYPDNDVTNKNSIGLAHGSCDYVLVKQYRYRMIESSISVIAQLTSNLNTPATETIMSDVAGTSATVTTA